MRRRHLPEIAEDSDLPTLLAEVKRQKGRRGRRRHGGGDNDQEQDMLGMENAAAHALFTAM
eukprot:SAG22_NODE_1339_length_4692_cov_4.252341_4_plen_61_part_00